MMLWMFMFLCHLQLMVGAMFHWAHFHLALSNAWHIVDPQHWHLNKRLTIDLFLFNQYLQSTRYSGALKKINSLNFSKNTVSHRTAIKLGLQMGKMRQSLFNGRAEILTQTFRFRCWLVATLLCCLPHPADWACIYISGWVETIRISRRI